MSLRVSMIDARVEVSDVLYALDSDEIASLIAEMPIAKLDEALRKRARAREPHPLEDCVDEAISLLRDGRGDEALLVLERNAHPKWKTLADCELAMRGRA